MNKSELWKREFLLHTITNLRSEDEASIQRLLATYDFDRKDAKMFQAGWDCCFHHVITAAVAAIEKVGHG